MTPRPTRRELVLAALLLALGAGLRCWRLDLGWFGIDQARDVQTALDIAAGRDFPVVGPTMRRVTSLGALYHYVWTLPQLASDDPLASYRFAAGLGVATLVAAWFLARRWWGPRAAIVALAVLATLPIAVIDGRVAWAPAALPPAATALLALFAAPATPARLAVLGAMLGVAVQLHLAMTAWVVAAAVLVLARRPSPGALVAGLAGGTATGFPAAYAALANAGHDAGLATLPGRGPLPDVVARLAAVWRLEWRVPAAFWQWADAPAPLPAVTCGLAALVTTAALLGCVRAAGRGLRGDRPAAALVVAGACQLGLVVLLPGEAWYYYLDALLPVAALAAGVLVAAAPGRLLTLGVKRDLAALLAADPAPFADRWESIHGPAVDDATGDNGFWLARAAAPSGAAPPPRHAVLWYRDDPSAPAQATSRFTIVDVGPLRVARYRPAIVYTSCRDADGAPAPVPIRVLPAPRRYGDGTIARPAVLPERITCDLDVPETGVRVVAAVGSGTVEVGEEGARHGDSGATSSVCIGGGPRRTRVVVILGAAASGEVDLYERPDPDCAAGKIAP